MNWYKIAQKIDWQEVERLPGLQEHDFYEFYVLLGLSDVAFANNPDSLYYFADKLNYMREYYLRYLFSAIGNELSHAIDREIMEENTALDLTYVSDNNIYLNVTVDYYYNISFDEFVQEYAEGDLGDEEDLREQYDDFLKNHEYWTLDQDVWDDIGSLVNNLYYEGDKVNIDGEGIKRVQDYFEELPWDDLYGGPEWARITKWTWQLYNAQPLNLSKIYGPKFLEQLRYLATLIDVIHSLCHNTANALNKLPNQEHYWMTTALDIVKYAPQPADLLNFVKNPHAIKPYRNTEIPMGISEIGHDKEYLLLSVLDGLAASEQPHLISSFIFNLRDEESINIFIKNKMYLEQLLQNHHLNAEQFKQIVTLLYEEAGHNVDGLLEKMRKIRYSYGQIIAYGEEMCDFLMSFNHQAMDIYILLNFIRLGSINTTKILQKMIMRYANKLSTPTRQDMELLAAIYDGFGIRTFSQTIEPHHDAAKIIHSYDEIPETLRDIVLQSIKQYNQLLLQEQASK